MEPGEDEELQEETLPEELPKEIREKKPTNMKLIAVVVAVIIIIAAVAGAWAMGLFGGGEEENQAPTVTTTISTHSAWVGDTIYLNATAEDEDGTVEEIVWYFGDGETGDEFNTTHAYDYPGSYIVYAVVTDDAGDTGDNEDQLNSMTLIVATSAPDEPGGVDQNATAEPYLVLAGNPDIIDIGDTVEFDAAASWAWVFDSWVNESDYSEGINWAQDIAGIDPMMLNYSDGSDEEELNTSDPTASHVFNAQGNHPVILQGWSGTDSAIYIKTIHVLKEASTVTVAVKNPDTIIYATIGEPDTLDPAIDYEQSGGEVLQNVYETLVWYDRESAEDLVPLLATELPTFENGRISPDGMMYNFTLRSGVTFHDGTDLTTEDVVYSIQRIARLDSPITPGWMVEQVVTANVGFYIGETMGDWTADNAPPTYLTDGLSSDPAHVITAADVDAVVENAVIAHDDYNLTIKLIKPYPAFLQICAYTVMDIVSKDYVEAHDDAYMEEHTCGSGPYKLVSWEKNSGVRLVRNDNYWRTPAPIKNIVILKVEDVNTRMLLLKAGDADIIYMPITYEDQFTDTALYTIDKGDPTFDVVFMAFNQDVNLADLTSRFGSSVTDVPSDFFADANVRRAFASAIDYETFVDTVWLGNAQQLNGPIPEGMYGYDPSIPKMDFDLEYARSQLENASTDWIATGFTLPIFYNAGNLYREAACNMLKDNLESLSPNIHIDIKPVTWSVYIPMMNADPCSMPLFTVGWGPDYADADDYVLPFMHSEYGIYPYAMGYVNLSMDALIEYAATEINETLRSEAYTNITWGAYYDIPYIWLYQAKNFHIERAWMSGYYYNPMYSDHYYYVLDK